MNEQNNDSYHALLRASLNWNNYQQTNSNNQNTNTTTTTKTGRFIDSNLSGGQNFGSNSNANFGTSSGDFNYASGGTFNNKTKTNNNGGGGGGSGGDDMTDDDSENENGSNVNGVAAAQQDVEDVAENYNEDDIDIDVNMDVGNQVNANEGEEKGNSNNKEEKERERLREGQARSMGFTRQQFEALFDANEMNNSGEFGLEDNFTNDSNDNVQNESTLLVQDVKVLEVDNNERGMCFKVEVTFSNGEKKEMTVDGEGFKELHDKRNANNGE